MRSAGQACGRGVWREAAAVSPVSVGAAPEAGAGRGEPLGGGARSVVAVALTGLVDEGPWELLGAAGRALPGPVLPLQRLLGQAVPLRQLLGPLRPLRLPRLVQRRRLHRQRPAAVRHRRLRPRLRNVLCSIVLGALPIHLEGAGDVDRHAGVLDEQVLHGAAPHAVGAGLLCKINYEPAILLLLFLDKGFGLLQALWRAAVTEEEAGETLKHGGEQSSRMDRETELLLGTSFQAQTQERWAGRGERALEVSVTEMFGCQRNQS